MTDLRRVVSSFGRPDAATYVQSRNVVFTAADLSASPASWPTVTMLVQLMDG